MILEVWSAGERNKTGKQQMAMGIILTVLWIAVICVMFIADMDNGGIDTSWVTEGLGAWAKRIFYCIFFMMVTFFIPFIGVNLVKISHRCMQDNVKFQMELIPINQFDTSVHSKADIVFIDKQGVVLTKNKEAYKNWELMNSVDSFSDFKNMLK